MNINKIVMIVIVILIICSILYNIVEQKSIKKSITEKNSQGIQQSSDENNNECNSLNKRVLLADILKDKDDIIITDDNIDNSIKIINKFKRKNGIYISITSREKFLEIINSIAQGTRYTINKEGYLSSTIFNKDKCSPLEQEVNVFFNSNKTIVVSIANTYKAMANGEQLDMLIERDSYVEKFAYDEKMKIAIINSRVLNDVSEENKKDLYENILITILQE